ncbi:hypothetical protein PCURB6_01780 [Paenibacillus curdlanolyticus]|nr:hypothetical protein PCURB6_01780 [Paenibacillus curdlanolyticus]
MKRRQAIIFGDYTNAPYHPLHQVEAEIVCALGSTFSTESTENARALETGLSPEVDLLVSYADRWSVTLTDEQADALLAFVHGGGGLLSLHCGISLANHPRLTALFGGRFVSHPDFQPLAYVPAGASITDFSFGGISHAGALEGRVTEGVPHTRLSAGETSLELQRALDQPTGLASGEATSDADRRRSLSELRASLQPFMLAEEPYLYEFVECPQGDRDVLLYYTLEGQLYPALWTQTYGQGRIVNIQPGHTAQSLQHPAVQQLLAAAANWAARG